LLVAIDKFNPSKTEKFSTYAWYWIKHFIQQEVKLFSREVLMEEIPDSGILSELPELNLEQCLEVLTTTERQILELWLQGHSLRSIGKRLGKSTERIRRLNERAMNKIKKSILKEVKG